MKTLAAIIKSYFDLTNNKYAYINKIDGRYCLLLCDDLLEYGERWFYNGSSPPVDNGDMIFIDFISDIIDISKLKLNTCKFVNNNFIRINS